eukprot:6210933-Pleurochrysis_carterae.AAC.2
MMSKRTRSTCTVDDQVDREEIKIVEQCALIASASLKSPPTHKCISIYIHDQNVFLKRQHQQRQHYSILPAY